MAAVRKTKKCPQCHGHGTCKRCSGTGEIVVAIDGKPVKEKAKKAVAGK